VILAELNKLEDEIREDLKALEAIIG